jgi:hypothetical protein
MERDITTVVQFQRANEEAAREQFRDACRTFHPNMRVDEIEHRIAHATPDGNFHGIAPAVVRARSVYMMYSDRYLETVVCAKYNGRSFEQIAGSRKRQPPTFERYQQAYKRVEPYTQKMFREPAKL